MDFYPHHIKSFAMQAGHLSVCEEGLYRRMLDWVYYHERPLPQDLAEVMRLIRIQQGSPEAVFVAPLLHEFFTLFPDGWHQSRADKEIEIFRASRVDGKSPAAVRQQRWREKKRGAVNYANGAALRNVSALLPGNPDIPAAVEGPSTAMTGGDISPGEPVGVAQDETLRETLPRHNGDAYVTPIRTRDLHTEIADSLKPLPTCTPEQAGLAARAMRQAGLAEANPGDPRLRALVAAGADCELLAFAAAEAVARKAGWPYALKVAQNRLAEGWTPPPRPKHLQQGPKAGRQAAGEEWLRVMCPQLLPEPQKPEEGNDVG